MTPVGPPHDQDPLDALRWVICALLLGYLLLGSLLLSL